jgi:hypothetical protein
MAANNLTSAGTLLNWVREDNHIEGGDDPLAGEAFPRIWTKTKETDPQLMRVAAASILVQSKVTAGQGIAILEQARNSASTESDKTNIDLALLTGAVSLGDYARELSIASDLAKRYPDSRWLFCARSFALRALDRFDEAQVFCTRSALFTPNLARPRKPVTCCCREWTCKAWTSRIPFIGTRSGALQNSTARTRSRRRTMPESRNQPALCNFATLLISWPRRG